MRKFLAWMVLLCSTACADAAETFRRCSEGAQLHFEQDGGWILRVDGQADEHLTGSHDIILADLILYGESTEQRQNDVVYARGRIFQPCQVRTSAPRKGSEREGEL